MFPKGMAYWPCLSEFKKKDMNVLFKDLTPGSIIYTLEKADDSLNYREGTIANVGAPRMELPKGGAMALPTSRQVVDVTFTLDGKSYTEAADTTAYMFQSNATGEVMLVATDKEPILRELYATLKKAEDFLATVDEEKARKQKRVEECKALISKHDNKFAEKQEFEKRIKKLEEGNAKTNELLAQILQKIK